MTFLSGLNKHGGYNYYDFCMTLTKTEHNSDMSTIAAKVYQVNHHPHPDLMQ